MKISKQGVWKVFKVVMFLGVAFLLYLFCTYFFRDTDRVSRQNILEFYDEPEDTLDVVFIGASGIYRYWDPMNAWMEHGFTSRNFSTSEMHIATYLTAIKEIMETQSPELIVLEARQFTRDFDSTEIAAGARRVIDSMDIGLDRLKAARYYCDIMGIPVKESLSLYVDLIQYHDNYDAFERDINWELADNRLDTVLSRQHCYKGYCITAKQNEFKDPSRHLSEQREPLHETADAVYRDLLSWCQENDVPLLVLATPFVVTETSVGRMNTIQDITESYGYSYVNTNEAYSDMGLVFSEDFYDGYHVNVLGSEKFTEYFAEYLKNNFELQNHRMDDAYAAWDDLYAEYETDQEKQKKIVWELIDRKEKIKALSDELLSEDSLVQWVMKTADEDITVVVMSNEQLEYEVDEDERLTLLLYGINDVMLEGNGQYAVIYNNAVEKTMFNKASGNLASGNLPYSVRFGDEASLMLGETEYYDVACDGIQMLAINNFTDEIIDSICVTANSDGTLRMEHSVSGK